MQTQRQLQAILSRLGVRPNRRLGQCFLIDRNLMGKLLALADLPEPPCGGEGPTVLEVGAGTGSLSEELIGRAGLLVAVELDVKLVPVLRRRSVDWDNFTLIAGDVLAGKNRISPEVLRAVAPRAQLVANLPYNIATPLVAECMLESWRAAKGLGVRFDSLTFTVQQEVASRFAATAGGEYGPVSVLLALLGRVTLGAGIPASAFWPSPAVAGRIVRVDFDAARAGLVRDAAVLRAVLKMTFSQRRKHLASTARGRGSAFEPKLFGEALAEAGIDPKLRPQEVPPEAYRDLANILAGEGDTPRGREEHP